jgi:hypothetical protein
MTEIERLQMNANQANSDFVAIKGKIVEKGVEVADGTRTAEYASKVDEVYEKGKQAQYDEFWDSYLTPVKNGTTSAGLFSGRGWTDATFNPPEFIDYIYDGYQLFLYASNISKEKLRMIDYSKLWRFQGAFNSTLITEIPVIDTRGSTELLSTVFAWTTSLISIEKLILKADGSQEFRGTFEGCSSLIEITIEGVIGQDGLNLKWSTKLSKASWISIINALSPTATGKSITGSLESVQRAFEVWEGAMDGDQSAEWLGRIADKANWTINLI